MLVSFQFASKHPENVVELFDNLEKMAEDPTCFEVIVKIDLEHAEMCKVMAEQAALRPFAVKYLVTPRGEGYAGLWRELNEVFTMTSPAAYFVCNINDEVRLGTQGWDANLRKYIGLFPDDIFRLRTSQLKFRNYYDFWECGYAPENYAFHTRRWLEIVGDWNPCFGPDSSQQYIAYYLGYANYPAFRQFNRDVPILDIVWGGEGVSVGLTEEQRIWRIATNFRLWMRQVSRPMQEELFRRGRLLQAHIMQDRWPDREIEIVTDSRSKAVLIRDHLNGKMLDLLSYRLSGVRLFFANLRRTMRYTYYCGGGREAWNFLPLSVIEFTLYYFPEIGFGFRRLLSWLESTFSFARFRKVHQPRKTRVVLNLNPLPWVAQKVRVDNWVWSWHAALKRRSTATWYLELNPIRGLVFVMHGVRQRLYGKDANQSGRSTPAVFNLNPLPWVFRKLRVHSRVWRWLAALEKRSIAPMYFELNPIRGVVYAVHRAKLALAIEGPLKSRRGAVAFGSAAKPVGFTINPLRLVERVLNRLLTPVYFEIGPPTALFPRPVALILGSAARPVGFTINPLRLVERVLNRLLTPVYLELNPLRWLINPFRWVVTRLRFLNRISAAVNANVVFNIYHHSRRLAWAVHLRDARWIRVNRNAG